MKLTKEIKEDIKGFFTPLNNLRLAKYIADSINEVLKPGSPTEFWNNLKSLNNRMNSVISELNKETGSKVMDNFTLFIFKSRLEAVKREGDPIGDKFLKEFKIIFKNYDLTPKAYVEFYEQLKLLL